LADQLRIKPFAQVLLADFENQLAQLFIEFALREHL